MASAAARALTADFRADQLALRGRTATLFLRDWPALDLSASSPDLVRWQRAMRDLVRQQRTASSRAAAAYLTAFRDAEDVPGTFRPSLAPDVVPGRLATATRVTSVVAFRTALRAGHPADAAALIARNSALGAVTRLVLEGGRETVVRGVRDDPRGVGWQRVSSATACAFCQMLAGRGAVYREDTADFATHDHCGCTAEAVYRR